MVRVSVALALAVALVGCRQEEPAPDPVSPAIARATAGLAPAQNDSGKPRSGSAILDAGGVALGRTAATARRFAYGAGRSAVDTAAEAALGQSGARSAIGECGAGPMEFTQFGRLKLNYQDGRFVGWFAEADPALVTSDGIRPGIRLRDLQATRSAKFVSDSTLDREFNYLAADGETIGGFAAGDGRDARVESLYAGVNCFFR